MPFSSSGPSITGPFWQQQWLRLLDSIDDPGRIRRGRAYARAGRVLRMAVVGGQITAMVRGSGWWNYDVNLVIPPLPAPFWEQLAGRLATDVRFEAALLDGELYPEVADVARDLGEALLPEQLEGLTMHCSCEDWVRPCKHLVAILLTLGDGFAQDPLLVLQMRGASLDDLAAHLRAARPAPATIAGAIANFVPPRPSFWGGTAPSAEPSPPASTPGGTAVLAETGTPPFIYDRRSFLTTMEQVYRMMQQQAAAALDLPAPAADQRRGTKN